MTDPRASAGVELWAVVTRLVATRGLLRPRQQVELRDAAVRAIAVINGQSRPPGFRMPSDDLKATFLSFCAELQARGATNGDLARWLDDTTAQRALLAHQRSAP